MKFQTLAFRTGGTLLIVAVFLKADSVASAEVDFVKDVAPILR